MNRKPYPSDVSDDEWAFVAPYLTLMSEEAPQREYALREVFNGLRWIVRTGAQWRWLPHDLPPWSTVYQQTQRWLAAGVFEAMVHDLRRCCGRWRRARPNRGRSSWMGGRCNRAPRAVPRRLGWGQAAARQQGAPRGGYLGPPAGAVGHPGQRAGADPGGGVGREGAGGDRRDGRGGLRGPGLHRGGQPAAEEHGIRLEVVKLPEAKRGFVLLPRRWVVERSFAWIARFRRLARDYERLPETLAGLHYVAFASLMLQVHQRHGQKCITGSRSLHQA